VRREPPVPGAIQAWAQQPSVPSLARPLARSAS